MEITTSHLNEEAKPSKGQEFEYLSAFVGEWHTEVGTESFSFLENEFFLVSKWDRNFGPDRYVGMGFIGYDTLKHKFVSQSCNNLGFARTYEVFIRKDVIFLDGQFERGKIYLSENQKELFIQWEINKQGVWKELCNLRGSRIH